MRTCTTATMSRKNAIPASIRNAIVWYHAGSTWIGTVSTLSVHIPSRLEPRSRKA